MPPISLFSGNHMATTVTDFRAPERWWSCLSFLFHPGHQRICRRRRRRAFRREGSKVITGIGVKICLPAIGKALGAARSARESMAIPVTSSSP